MNLRLDRADIEGGTLAFNNEKEGLSVLVERANLTASAESIKGPFAQALVQELRGGARLLVPDYLADAVTWVTHSDDGGGDAETGVEPTHGG